MPSGATLTARAPKMRGLARRAAVAAVLGHAGAGEGVDDAAREIDDPHPVVGDIGDIEAPFVGIEGEPVRLGETRPAPPSRHRRNMPPRRCRPAS